MIHPILRMSVQNVPKKIQTLLLLTVMFATSNLETCYVNCVLHRHNKIISFTGLGTTFSSSIIIIRSSDPYSRSSSIEAGGGCSGAQVLLDCGRMYTGSNRPYNHSNQMHCSPRENKKTKGQQ